MKKFRTVRLEALHGEETDLVGSLRVHHVEHILFKELLVLRRNGECGSLTFRPGCSGHPQETEHSGRNVELPHSPVLRPTNPLNEIFAHGVPANLLLSLFPHHAKLQVLLINRGCC